MKNSFLSLSITLAAMITFISCQKTEPTSTAVISSSFKINSFPKVYTNAGEITDQSTVRSYVIATAAPGYFYWTSDTIINVQADTIKYGNGDTVLFHLPVNFAMRIEKQSGNLTYFYLTDTVLTNSRIANPLNTTVDQIGVYKPFYQDACPPPVPVGGCAFALVYDAFIANGDRTQFDFPLLTYQLSRKNNLNTLSVARKNYNNILDPAFINLLQNGDTLIVQSGDQTYRHR